MGKLSAGRLPQSSTTSASSSSSPSPPSSSSSLMEWMQQNYQAEWTTVKFNFLSGIVCFSLAAALRAKLTMVCPVLAAACVGVLLSSTLLSLAFVHDVEEALQPGKGGLVQLPLQMVSVTWRSSRKSPLFFVASVSYFLTCAYVAIQIPHLYRYLASAGK
mmetsp:Transcript_13454/g.25805  ORF Transcript_13454/g.25805 Transcript_13454/m.25805 type:complete len:160 (-) Transcript_13454:151-630(-)